VLQERARLAFFDVRKLLDATGKPKAIQDLDDDTAAAIQGLDVANIGSGEVGVGEVLKIKLADKNASLTALEKHLGLYRDGDQAAPLQIHIHL
jgi:phage terminase small subunit